MGIRELGQSVHPMANAVSLAQALERRERASLVSVSSARRSLARKLKIGLGTFENLVRGRVKSCDAAIRDRLHALLVRELESEIARLTHELELARQTGAHLADDQVSAIETHLFAAKTLLEKGVRGSTCSTLPTPQAQNGQEKYNSD